jgi:hypothetical protein
MSLSPIDNEHNCPKDFPHGLGNISTNNHFIFTQHRHEAILYPAT